MAVSTFVVKKTTTTAVLKFVGNGSTTISLSADLFAAQQSLNGDTLKVHVAGVLYSSQTTNNIKIIRNSVEVLSLYGNGDWNIDGFSLTEQESSDITVDLGSGGTVIIELKKVSGYTPGPIV